MKWQGVFNFMVGFGKAHPFLWIAVVYPYLAPLAIISWIKFRRLSEDERYEAMEEYQRNIKVNWDRE